MKITKPLNNNVVMAFDHNEEVIVVGTGIGFHKKAGDIIDPEKIQKIFLTSESSKLRELISQIPAEYLELTEKIVNYAKQEYNATLDENVYLILTDHIYFALERIKDHLDIDNPFLVDIKQFYQEEYEIGIYAKKLILEMFEIEIPDYEIGYIAMHIIETRYEQDRRDFDDVFKVINTSIDFIKKNYLKDIDETSLAYTRLMNHVKYFAKRYIENNENSHDDVLLNETIQGVFQKENQCLDDLSQLLEERFGKVISGSEKNYLILHLRNCLNI